MTRPTSASGARTASRVPTTMSTSPARMRRHSSARSPSPSPEWTSATRASRSARSRSTSGSAREISGHEHQRPPAVPEDLGDRLDVDRRLAAAGDAFEEQRRRVTGRQGGGHDRERLGLRREAGRSQAVDRRADRPRARPSGRRGRSRTSASTRPRRTSPAIGGGAVARPRSRRLRRPSARPRARAGRVELPRPEGSALDLAPGRDKTGRRHAGRREPDPALVARPGRGREERPVERDHPAGRERSEPADEAGASLRSRQVAGRSRAAVELVDQVEVDDGRARPRRRRRAPVRRRVRAARASPAAASPAGRAPPAPGSGSRSTRPARARVAAAAARRHGPGRRWASRRSRQAASDAGPRMIPSACRFPYSTRTASPGSRSARVSGTVVGVGPRAGGPGRVDGDLDVPRPGGGRIGTRRQAEGHRSTLDADPPRRMEPWVSAMIASMVSAVRSTWPVSLTTTWS